MEETVATIAKMHNEESMQQTSHFTPLAALKQVPEPRGSSLARRAFSVLQDVLIYRPRMRQLGIAGEQTPLFNSVFLEVRTRCNGTCSFCAASIQREIRPDVSMSKEMYERVIDELAEISFSGILAPYVNSDPLLYRGLTDLVRYARAKLPSAWIQILTNGKALTLDKARALIEAGADELHVNHYDDDFTAALPQRLITIRDDLLPSMFPPDQLQIGTDPPLSEARPRGVFLFNIVRRKEHEVLTSRAGTAPNVPEPSTVPRGFCEYPFTQLNMTADGRVAQCCSDLYFSNVMGNVTEESLREIWFGPEFRRVRGSLLRGNRNEVSTCGQCDFCGVKSRPAAIATALQWYRSLDRVLGGRVRQLVHRLAG